jgi:hypothetical protein
MPRFEFEFGTLQLFYFYHCFVWRIVFACLLVCSGRCGMAGSDEDRGGSRRPGAEE